MGKPDTSKTQATEAKITGEEVALAEKQDARAQTLFDESNPGFKTAVDHYTKLSTGDPATMFKEVAPGAQQISQKFDSAKQQISENSPRGGAKDLAMEEADISKAGAVGNLINTSYTSSFPALANLSGKGMGLSINEVGAAISAFGGASNTASNLANQQEAGKAASLGFLSSMGGDVAMLGAAA